MFVPPPRPDQWGWNGEQMERYYIETAVSLSIDILMFSFKYFNLSLLSTILQLRRNKYDDFSILDVHRKIYPSQKEVFPVFPYL